jgi:type I restriction enzyme S subunit
VIAGLKTVMIGDAIEIVSTWNPTSTEPDGTFRYIDLSAVDQDTKQILGARTLLCSEAPSRARQLVATDDVLVSTVRPNLNGVARVTEELDGATASTGFCVLRAHQPLLDPGYLFQWVKTPMFISNMVRKATGASYPAVSDRIVTESRLPLPPLTELDRTETLEEKRRATLAKCDTLTQAIFLELFGDPVTNRQGFPISLMGDVCDVRDGTHESPKYVSDGGYPLVTSKNLSGGVVDLTDVSFISEEDYVQINRRSKVDRGDIIMPMIGTIGSPVLIDHEPRYGIKNVALIKFTDSSPSAIYVCHLLSCHYFDHIINQKNRGGTQKFISLGDLRSFPLPLPPIGLQREFASRRTIVENLKTLHRVSLKKIVELFGSLQQRAFQGEL